MRERNEGSSHRVLRRQVAWHPSMLPSAEQARCEEFIHLISSEANEICEQESKKTIAPEHIITALKVLDLVISQKEHTEPVVKETWLREFHVRSRGCVERSQEIAEGAYEVLKLIHA